MSYKIKVMMVAVFNDRSTNSWQAQGFENIGVDVVRYNYRKRAEEIGVMKRDNEIIDVCNNENPDIILYSKCNTVNINVVRECNKVGKTVLWFMDPKSRIDSELIQKMKECNMVFCSRYDGINEAVRHNKMVFRLQGGYDPTTHYPLNVPYTRDVAFIGNVNRHGRKEYIDKVEFDVVENVYGSEHSRVVSETKINLNFNEGDGTSNRLYKLLAAKGFVLTQPWERMEDDWVVGSDLVVFNNLDELKDKIQYYLLHQEEREEIAMNGYLKVKEYDNNNYAKTIIKMYNDRGV